MINKVGSLVLVTSIQFIMLFAHGCSRNSGGVAESLQPGAPHGSSAEPGKPTAGRAVTEYPLSGVVKQVETERQRVTIDHEAIPGFMDAMTMPFSYADRAVLDRLAPGDRVKGKLRVEKENGLVRDYQLVDLAVTGRTSTA
jgi:protein SCO1/2